MKAIVLFAGLAFLLFSCERDQPEPKPQTKSHYRSIIPIPSSAMNSSLKQGSIYRIALEFKFGIMILTRPMKGMQVKFRVLSGGGTVDDDTVITNEEGRAFDALETGHILS